MTDAGPLSGERLNPIVADVEAWAHQLYDDLMRDFFASGYPVGAEPQPPAVQYAELITLRDSGSDEYWHNPQAQRDLTALERRFGPARPMAVPSLPGAQQLQAQAPMLQLGFLPPPSPLASSSPVNVPVQGSPLAAPVAPGLGG